MKDVLISFGHMSLISVCKTKQCLLCLCCVAASQITEGNAHYTKQNMCKMQRAILFTTEIAFVLTNLPFHVAWETAR